jgi:hypothetical protein
MRAGWVVWLRVRGEGFWGGSGTAVSGVSPLVSACDRSLLCSFNPLSNCGRTARDGALLWTNHSFPAELRMWELLIPVVVH